MRKICLVFLINENFDCLASFEQAFKESGFDVEAIRLPNVWISGLNRKYVSELKALFREKKSQGRSIVFSPQSTELFLSEADLTITYSAYQSWFDFKKNADYSALVDAGKVTQVLSNILYGLRSLRSASDSWDDFTPTLD